MDKIEGEIFKDIDGFENLYMISNYGRVYGKKHKKIKKNIITKRGYYTCMLMNRDIKKLCTIHQLIAKHFIPNPEGYRDINHIDGNKLNNDISNLEWCNHDQNMKHAFRTGLADNSGSKNGMAKLTEEDVIKIRELYDSGKYYCREIAPRFRVSRETIGCIARRKTWAHI